MRSAVSESGNSSSERVIWIDPQRIRRHTNFGTPDIEPRNRVFVGSTHYGHVAGGDWDIGGIRTTELAAVEAMRARIHDGIRWQDTAYYRECANDILRGRTLWGCESLNELDARFQELDLLIESIRRRGLLVASEARRLGGGVGRVSDDILVNIGRSGEFLFQDGRHRLGAALALGIARVPVKVLVRHKRWQEFRDFLFSMTKGSGGAAKDGVLYQTPSHPDLLDIPFERSCEDRANAIRENLIANNGRFIDIGCNLGYFSHALEDAGLDGIAVEYTPDIAYAAEIIRMAEGRRFRVINCDVLSESLRPALAEFGPQVVVALSIFHHFLKTETDFIRLSALLEWIRPRQLYLETHTVNEVHMRAAYRNFSPTEFVAFVQEKTGLKHAKLIFTSADGRPLYSLYS